MAEAGGPHGLLTLVCITCGHEKFFAATPPAALRCDKCKGRVFRNYFTPVEADEATVSQLEETARSFSYEDGASALSEDERREMDAQTGPESERPQP